MHPKYSIYSFIILNIEVVLGSLQILYIECAKSKAKRYPMGSYVEAKLFLLVSLSHLLFDYHPCLLEAKSPLISLEKGILVTIVRIYTHMKFLGYICVKDR
jgi:hypothetical protein